ncbi:hypothetical protein J4760_05335 [Salinicoccus sp. ID82-1]|uniref:Uncharacterized protein n=1 Tax=Salinicoccus cyprini TaxID=2493691 RepID=A0A558B029_9STAP|nr:MULTISPECIES: DUF6320 domain-containing protein [Salinicoccus]MCG1009469.1 hypothetical protein [Salinicoccus sp. ID82-1]TVT29836.1 hypothetical protein FO441_06085 [Salinicoccus cyprini]
MNHCEQCTINTKHNICPLCSQQLASIDSKMENRTYPAYDRQSLGKRKAPRIAVFAGLSIILACIFINLIIMPHFLWVFYVMGSVAYAVISLNHTILSKSHLGSKIVGQVASLTLLLLLIDSQSGFLRWSINYAVPFLIVAGLVMVTLSILTKRLKWKGYISSILMIALSFLPAALYFSGHATVIWPSAVASLYAFMLIVFFGVFAHQTLWTQLSRRLHI